MAIQPWPCPNHEWTCKDRKHCEALGMCRQDADHKDNRIAKLEADRDEARAEVERLREYARADDIEEAKIVYTDDEHWWVMNYDGSRVGRGTTLSEAINAARGDDDAE